MKCASCNKNATTLFTMINETTKETHLICDTCFVESTPQTNNISKLDEEIAEVEALLKKSEEIVDIAKNDKISEISDTDESFAMFFTPLKVHKILKSTLDNLTIQKLQIFSSMPELDRFKYELKMAIEKENYEKAAEWRDKINKLLSNKL